MSFNKSQRSMLTGLVAFLVLVVAALQHYLDPLRRQPAIEPPKAANATKFVGAGNAQLPFEYTLGAVTGFRQVIAGLLWVRSDAFFHEGNYDAILPLIRIITWLDPNWLDPYSTGAWHLMYNFTDTDQRSDRRYIPAGMALLQEGIDNNPTTYDMYKEAGWNNFDKIKNYAEAAKFYKEAEVNDPHYDVTTVGHALAHAYERMGDIPAAIAEWRKNVAAHKALLDDPKSSSDIKSRNSQGYKNSLKNLNLLIERQAVRGKDATPPVDAKMTFKVTRVKSKVIEVSGTFNLQGAKNWAIGKGILEQGPVNGARIDVRLQDAGYVLPHPKEFSFEVDDKLTIMQDSISIRGGRMARKGELYVLQPTDMGMDTAPSAQAVAIYGFGPGNGKGLGVPLAQALAGGAPLSPLGELQAVSVAYPLPIDPSGKSEKEYAPAEVAPLFAKLKGDTAKIADLTKQGYCVATRDVELPGSFKRQIDMSKDPNMYSFTKDKYDFIVSFNPQSAPDFVKDRIGWAGEGLTDKRFLDTKTIPGIHLLRAQVTLSRADLTDAGQKTLVAQ
jgi:tetratricopeptide (TPR) repeat protein